MRVSREQAEQNRKKVLRTAAQLFRKRGTDGVGVAELMNTAGMTHGGFYGQFDSKEDLVTQAVAQALQENEASWRLALKSATPWETYKHNYLSASHCRHPERGCAFSTLAVEAPRHGASFKSVLTKGLQSLIGTIESIAPKKRGKTRRQQAMFAASAMLGALVLARAVDDKALAEELLEAVKQGI